MARKKVNVYESENDIFPVKLRMLMAETGTSQEALANYVGVTRQSIGYYTQGQSSPDWRGLVKIAEFFKVSLDYLLTDVEIKSPDVGMKATCAYTGLSEASVSNIRFIRKLAEVSSKASEAEQDRKCFELLDCFLSSKNAFEMSIALSRTQWNCDQANRFVNGLMVLSHDAEKRAQELTEMISELQSMKKNIRYEEMQLCDTMQAFSDEKLDAANIKQLLGNLQNRMYVDVLKDKD